MRERFHYAFVVLAVTFFVLFVAAGVRAIPSVVIKPLETEFNWERTSISFSVALSLFAYGLGGPFSGTLINRFGPRRVMALGLAMSALGLLPLLWMTELWQLYLFWGVVVGVGTGAIANVLGATVANRWFNKNRGLALGLMSGSVAVGQLILLPLMVTLTADAGWRATVGVIGAAAVLMLIPVALLMRDQPSDIGAEPYGGKIADAPTSAPDGKAVSLRDALRTRDFWLLAGSFFICGYTTNGMIGTHLLPHTIEHGFVEVESAYAIGLMGAMNMVGTLISGWLSDRFDNRKLLATYYGLRGLSLVALPFIIEFEGLLIFSVIYGLDWVATVPPTVNLTAQRFGRSSLSVIYGWIFCSHMFGAGIAAQAGGFFRDLMGDYHLIFLSAALMGLIAAGLSMRISNNGKPQPQVVTESA